MSSNYTKIRKETAFVTGQQLAQANRPILAEALEELHINLLQKIVFVNVTDLVFCPRQSCFKRLQYIPENQKQDKFLMGRLVTIKLQQALLASYPGQYEIEKQVQYNCANFHSTLAQGFVVYLLGKIDAFSKQTGPLEFKSIWSEKKITEPRPYDVQQIKYYMAMSNSPTGVLGYYHLDARFADDRYVEFAIEMAEEELYSEHQKLVIDTLALSNAILAAKPELARHIAYNYQLANFKCKSCPYSGDCKDMRIAANGFKPKGAETINNSCNHKTTVIGGAT